MGNIILKKSGSSTGDITRFVRTFDCASTVAVGNIVYSAPNVDNFVFVNVDNTVVAPSIGIVIEKPTSFTCKVQMYGPCSITFSGLLRSKKVFLSTTGGLTTTVPTTGYLQKIGFSYENDKVFIDPNEIRVKLNP